MQVRTDMNKKQLSALMLATCVSGAAMATDKMYGVISSGYTDMEFSSIERDNYNYSMAIGHQFAKQWYVEAGYMKLVDDVESAEGANADSLYLAVLGKAGSRQGELYYKLGVANVDVEGIESAGQSGSELGDTLPGSTTLCGFDESVVAGLVGVGFDYHIGLSSMIRLEALYFKGEHDFTANVFNLGFRYNFN